MNEQLGHTMFQEGHSYDSSIHIELDRVMVYGLNETLISRMDSWSGQGFKVALMTGLAWGAYDDYLDGEKDGIQHRALEVQMSGDGNPILHGDSKNVSYLVPTSDFRTYYIEKLLPVVDAGIDEFFFEEPEFWVDSGYSPAFKAAWEERYSSPWQGQHTNAEIHWMAAKLKSELYLELFEQTAKALKEYGSKKNRNIRCFVATHSLINYAQWRLVSPESAFLRSAYCDGMIGQVWTGTSRTPNVLRGKRKTRTFYTAFLEYGYFASLIADEKRALWALHDPVEDNPDFAWPEYRFHYLRTVVASLLRPNISRFEICPWPLRIFSRPYKGELIPKDYHIVLRILFDALRQMGQYQGEWASEVEEVGLFVDDSALFQRPAAGLYAVKYDGTRADSEYDEEIQRVVCWSEFFGLALPLLEKGIVVTPIPFKSAALHPDSLRRFNTIALSYQFMKPLDPLYHQMIASWVKDGGNLLYVGDGKDNFQSVPEWWNEDGRNSRTALQDLQLQLGFHNDDNFAVETNKVGNGTFTQWSIDPAMIAEDDLLADEWVNKITAALGTAKIQESPWIVRRGPYVFGIYLHEGIHVLEGEFVDLTTANLPVVTNPQLLKDEPFLFYDMQQVSESGHVIASTVRMDLVDEHDVSFACYEVTAPTGTPVVARLCLPRSPDEIVLQGESGRENVIRWKWNEASKTVCFQFDHDADTPMICIHMSV